MMEELPGQVSEIGQEKPLTSPEDHYYQHMKEVTASWQHSRQVIWELYQELRAHHSVVQACYEALETAMKSGQETKTLWDEYHEAINRHRLLVNRFRLAMQQQRLRDTLN